MIAVPASAPKSAAEAAAFMEAQARTRQLTTAPGASGIATWFLCFVSFSGLQAIQAIGTLAAIVFIAPWALLLAWRIPALVAALARDRILLLFPLFALCTTAWSQYPAMSLRHGLEFLVTTIIGIAAARCVERRTIVTSLLFALAIPTLASVLMVRHLSDFHSGGFAGIYGDKNQLASYSAALLIVSAVFLISGAERRILRLLCAALAGLALLGVILGHSAATLVSLVIVAAWAAFSGTLRRGGMLVTVAFMCGVAVVIVVLASIGFGDAYSGLLHGLGKDSSLTGRTDLWQEAWRQIGLHPLAGCGFAAFWVVGNPAAEQLWAAFDIAVKMGFSFHNTYIEMAVESGVIYAILHLLMVLYVVIGVMKDEYPDRDAGIMIVKSLLLFYFIISFVEPEFGLEFCLQTIILCMAWEIRRTGERKMRLAPAKDR